MLTKKQFLERLNFIIELDDRTSKFDQALREFAPSDFTGFYDTLIHNHLIESLVEDMEDDSDLISWWLYDCPDQGRSPEHCKIWEGNKDDPNSTEWDVSTPEKLYNYIFIHNSKAPSKETIQMAIRAQDNGVKMALKEIQNARDNNKRTQNEGWEDREALLKYIQTQIKNQYRFQRGIGADLNFDKIFHIISVLEEES